MGVQMVADPLAADPLHAAPVQMKNPPGYSDDDFESETDDDDAQAAGPGTAGTAGSETDYDDDFESDDDARGPVAPLATTAGNATAYTDDDFESESDDDEAAAAQGQTGEAEAREFLTRNGYHDAEIVDRKLTSGNCHGFTFGSGGDVYVSCESMAHMAQLRAGPGVLMCWKEGVVAHSAKWGGGGWEQTLNGGPVFRSSRGALEAHGYDCFDMGNDAEAGAFNKLVADKEDSPEGVEAKCMELQDLLGEGEFPKEFEQQRADGPYDKAYRDKLRAALQARNSKK
jgi:hypothetical protein